LATVSDRLRREFDDAVKRLELLQASHQHPHQQTLTASSRHRTSTAAASKQRGFKVE
jgi:hypothetical protein